jgi:hypothetical protein
MTAVIEKMNFLSIFLILSVAVCYRSSVGLSPFCDLGFTRSRSESGGSAGMLSQNQRPEQRLHFSFVIAGGGHSGNNK